MTHQQMIRAGYSLREAEIARSRGLISEREFRAYALLWDWSAPRFHGRTGERQERFYSRCGREAYERRIDRAAARVRSILAA